MRLLGDCAGIGAVALVLAMHTPAMAAPFCADARDPAKPSGPPPIVWENSPPFPPSLAAPGLIVPFPVPLPSGGLVINARPQGAARSDKRQALVFLNDDGTPKGAAVPVDLGPGFEIAGLFAVPDGSVMASVMNFSSSHAPIVVRFRRDGSVDWRRELPSSSSPRPGKLDALLPLSDGGAVVVLEPEVAGDPVRTIRLAADGRVLGEDDTLKYPLMAKAALLRGNAIRIFGAVAGGVWARVYDSDSFRLLAGGILLDPQDGYALGWPLVRNDVTLVVPGTIRGVPSVLWFGVDGKLMRTSEAPNAGGFSDAVALPSGGIVAISVLQDEGESCFVHFDAEGRERGRYLLVRKGMLVSSVRAAGAGDGALFVTAVDVMQPSLHPGHLLRLKFE